jgi:hypothetical protein
MLELALMLLPLRTEGTALEQRADLVLPFELADHRIVELGGAPGAELVLVGRRGELRSWNLRSGELKGNLQLSTPARTLLSYARVSSDEPHERVLVLDERGVRALRTDAEGVIQEAHDELSKRVRWTLHSGVPRFVDFAPDLNQDGSAELVAPRGNRMEIWRRMPQTGAATEQYDRIAAVEIAPRRSRSTNASIASDTLFDEYDIPALKLLDQNGDGRKDLWVMSEERGAWHIFGPNGEIPSEPTVSVDFSLYQDSPASEQDTLSAEAFALQQPLTARDLDGDGVLDFAIARGRKVWIYPGTPQGPQFERPSAILRSAQDISAMIFAPMDADELPDLLLVRVIKPGVGTLIQGLLAEWEVQIDALAYPNQGKGTFAREPSRRATILVRLPPILDVLKNADKLIARFVTALRNLRTPIEGDYDGDGKTDIALLFDDVEAKERRVELWLAVKGQLDPAALDQETLLRTLIFDTEDKLWTVDRTLDWLGGLGKGIAKELHGNRPPDGIHRFDAADTLRIESAQAADLDGDGRDELVLVRRSLDAARTSTITVLGAPR